MTDPLKPPSRGAKTFGAVMAFLVAVIMVAAAIIIATVLVWAGIQLLAKVTW